MLYTNLANDLGTTSHVGKVTIGMALHPKNEETTCGFPCATSMIFQAKAEVWSGELSLHECAQVATLATVESEILLQQNGGLIRMGGSP
jgi:hypothetical protein